MGTARPEITGTVPLTETVRQETVPPEETRTETVPSGQMATETAVRSRKETERTARREAEREENSSGIRTRDVRDRIRTEEETAESRLPVRRWIWA